MSVQLHQPDTRTMCAKLDESARARLISRAALFGIDAHIDSQHVHISLHAQGKKLCLPLETGLSRLVAELGEVLTPWVIFSAGKPPEKVLLQYTDRKYDKLVGLWRDSQEKDRACARP
jgi:hypothetical protein